MDQIQQIKWQAAHMRTEQETPHGTLATSVPARSGMPSAYHIARTEDAHTRPTPQADRKRRAVMMPRYPGSKAESWVAALPGQPMQSVAEAAGGGEQGVPPPAPPAGAAPPAPRSPSPAAAALQPFGMFFVGCVLSILLMWILDTIKTL